MFLRTLILSSVACVLCTAASLAASELSDLDRASELCNNGHYQESIDLCTRLVGTKHEAPRLYIVRGNAYSYLGKDQTAVVDYTKALSLKPNSVAAYESRSDSYVRLGEYEKAIEDCDKGIKLNANEGALYCNRGEAEFKLGKHQSAINDLTFAVELSPVLGEAYYFRGLAYEKIGNAPQATADKLKSEQLGYKPGVSAITDFHNTIIKE